MFARLSTDVILQMEMMWIGEISMAGKVRGASADRAIAIAGSGAKPIDAKPALPVTIRGEDRL